MHYFVKYIQDNVFAFEKYLEGYLFLKDLNHLSIVVVVVVVSFVRS